MGVFRYQTTRGGKLMEQRASRRRDAGRWLNVPGVYAHGHAFGRMQGSRSCAMWRDKVQEPHDHVQSANAMEIRGHDCVGDCVSHIGKLHACVVDCVYLGSFEF
ncbi:hypothetical protein J1N35_004480 [Gossypium stocksii]|uniref:Uncharacterized protein n=1 Tax=Gossypium stocksii TaxID=47602 RepID=A0A9D3WE74_9ROSI|nr:hypothetical protein J1N35_004480 [Gossypium stocksii]